MVSHEEFARVPDSRPLQVQDGGESDRLPLWHHVDSPRVQLIHIRLEMLVFLLFTRSHSKRFLDILGFPNVIPRG